jgi:hypothetical protein
MPCAYLQRHVRCPVEFLSQRGLGVAPQRWHHGVHIDPLAHRAHYLAKGRRNSNCHFARGWQCRVLTVRHTAEPGQSITMKKTAKARQAYFARKEKRLMPLHSGETQRA